MTRRPPPGERGAALLAVLLLVAVTGAIAVVAMEKLRLSRAVAMNVIAVDQARAYARGVEQLGLLTIDDLIASNPERTTAAGGWMSATRRIPLPGGGIAEARVRDGGNCYNLNSLVEGDPRTALARRNSGVLQFVGLMLALNIPEANSRRIAEAGADWADSDSEAGPGGAEDAAYAGGPNPYRAANTLFTEIGEARLLAGMTPEIFATLRPWLCVLPVADLSPLNVNTLTPDQAPLLAMLAPGQIDIRRAQRVLEARPAAGWGNMIDFWRTDRLSDLAVPLDAQLQPQVRTRWFTLELNVSVLDSEFSEVALVDSRIQPSRLAVRRWGE